MTMLGDEHEKVVAYVNQVIGTNAAEMTSVEAPYKDVAIIDLINHIQADTVKQALARVRVRVAAGVVAGGGVLAERGDSGGERHDPGCGGSVCLREHAGSLNFCTLPLEVMGYSFINKICRGRLKLAICPRQKTSNA